MDLHLFDLNLLVALDALLRECNVTQAGNRLNLSQSAMSGALARLRHHFRDELLVPVGRQMVLTPVAEGLVGVEGFDVELAIEDESFAQVRNGLARIFRDMPVVLVIAACEVGNV